MTSYGQDIDAFIATYIPESKKKLATLELKLIAVKAMKAQLLEDMAPSLPPYDS